MNLSDTFNYYRYKGPYNCPKCTKQFTRRFNLQLHLQKGCAKKKRNSYWPANKEKFEEYGKLNSYWPTNKEEFEEYGKLFWDKKNVCHRNRIRLKTWRPIPTTIRKSFNLFLASREQIQPKVQLNQGKRKSGIWHKCGKCGQAFTGMFGAVIYSHSRIS